MPAAGPKGGAVAGTVIAVLAAIGFGLLAVPDAAGANCAWDAGSCCQGVLERLGCFWGVVLAFKIFLERFSSVSRAAGCCCPLVARFGVHSSVSQYEWNRRNEVVMIIRERQGRPMFKRLEETRSLAKNGDQPQFAAESGRRGGNI